MRQILVVLLMLSTVLAAGRSFAHDSHPSIRVAAAPSLPPDERRTIDALTRRLLDQNARRLNALDAGEKKSALNNLLTVAAARQQRLAALMQDHPGEIIRAAVAADVRAALPPEVRKHVEEHVALEGDLEVLHADGTSESRYLHWLDLGTSRMSLHFAATPPEHQSGDRVRVQAIRVHEALALGTSGTPITLLAAAVPNTFGAQKTAVILVAFQDQPTVTSVTVSEAHDVVFASDSSVSNFYAEASYQQTSLTGSVFGPYTIPVNSSSSACDHSGIAQAAELAAMARGIDLTPYTRRVYAFPVNSCWWWGLATVGGNPSRAWINGTFVNGVVAHEMGHNLGMYHSHALECGSSAVGSGSECTNLEYGDSLDTMGSPWPPKHFNAPQKERLGWLNYGVSPPITTVDSTGEYIIDPYESIGSNSKALKVRTPSGDWYYMEYRQPIGFDTAIPYPSVFNGIVVHLVTKNDPTKIFLLDMTPATSTWSDPALGVNESFTDTAAGLTITPVSANTTNARVHITMASSCVHNAPTVLASSPSQTGGAGVPLTYTVYVTNNDTSCAPSVFTMQASAPAGWTTSFAPTTLTISAAGSGSTTLTVTPSTSAAAGTHTISVTATSPTSTGPATTTYVVGPAQSFPLTVARTGLGSVSSSPGGIDCGTKCSADFTSGATVTLAAPAANGFTFTGWTGDCQGLGNCVISVTKARFVTATFAPADLVVTAVANPPAIAQPGDRFTATDTTANVGLGAARSSRTRYYLSAAQVRSSDDTPLTRSRLIGVLASGASSAADVIVAIPANTPLRDYYLLACADDTSLVQETSDTNNCRASTTTVRLTQPDLVESSVLTSTVTAAPGGSFAVTDTVVNSGAVAAGSSTTRYYLSAVGTGAKLLKGTRAVPVLDPAGTSMGTTTVRVPSNMPLGSYVLLACANDTGAVPEVDQTNNCTASPTPISITP